MRSLRRKCLFQFRHQATPDLLRPSHEAAAFPADWVLWEWWCLPPVQFPTRISHQVNRAVDMHHQLWVVPAKRRKNTRLFLPRCKRATWAGDILKLWMSGINRQLTNGIENDLCCWEEKKIWFLIVLLASGWFFKKRKVACFDDDYTE